MWKKKKNEHAKLATADGLCKHTAEFTPARVFTVESNVHVAVGYGLANTAMIVGPTGVVIIDTMESMAPARDVVAALSKLRGDKPCSAVILTHNHADHVMGTKAFTNPDRSTQIWAHDSFMRYLNGTLSGTGKITYTRAMRQFGVFVPKEQFVNCGIGPVLRENSERGLEFPTHTFVDRQLIQVAGLELELIHAPGETNDQIVVWYPEKRILFGADNIYKSFPNIYAIRGTPSRDAMQWVRSLDVMASLRPEHLVLGHTQPVQGADTISELITKYRDAIQFVHDQTLRFMNQGLHLGDIVDRVRLPPSLAQHPFLQEHYGRVEWAVRAVFTHHLGWFDGDPLLLRPLTKSQRSVRLAGLAGGVGVLVKEANVHVQKAQNEPDLEVKRGHAQWALELADAAVHLENGVTKLQHSEAVRLRGEALRELGVAETSSTGRNYYLTSALENDGQLCLTKIPREQVTWNTQIIPTMHQLMSLLSVRLVPDRVAATPHMRIGFLFADTKEQVMLEFRNCVCLVHKDEVFGPEFEKFADLLVKTTSTVWREICSQKRTPTMSFMKGDLKVVKGNVMKVAALMSAFELEETIESRL
eukprot:c8288_g1_i1.p1 GENE.c8288_g1_i1~~c8288_g1_i1.p1  ORF type:complete len:587 (-),score=127.57 c8288_g1_i1:53-1813(-)